LFIFFFYVLSSGATRYFGSVIPSILFAAICLARIWRARVEAMPERRRYYITPLFFMKLLKSRACGGVDMRALASAMASAQELRHATALSLATSMARCCYMISIFLYFIFFFSLTARAARAAMPR